MAKPPGAPPRSTVIPTLSVYSSNTRLTTPTSAPRSNIPTELCDVIEPSPISDEDLTALAQRTLGSHQDFVTNHLSNRNVYDLIIGPNYCPPGSPAGAMSLNPKGWNTSGMDWTVLDPHRTTVGTGDPSRVAQFPLQKQAPCVQFLAGANGGSTEKTLKTSMLTQDRSSLDHQSDLEYRFLSEDLSELDDLGRLLSSSFVDDFNFESMLALSAPDVIMDQEALTLTVDGKPPSVDPGSEHWKESKEKPTAVAAKFVRGLSGSELPKDPYFITDRMAVDQNIPSASGIQLGLSVDERTPAASLQMPVSCSPVNPAGERLQTGYVRQRGFSQAEDPSPSSAQPCSLADTRAPSVAPPGEKRVPSSMEGDAARTVLGKPAADEKSTITRCAATTISLPSTTANACSEMDNIFRSGGHALCPDPNSLPSIQRIRPGKRTRASDDEVATGHMSIVISTDESFAKGKRRAATEGVFKLRIPLELIRLPVGCLKGSNLSSAVAVVKAGGHEDVLPVGEKAASMGPARTARGKMIPHGFIKGDTSKQKIKRRSPPRPLVLKIPLSDIRLQHMVQHPAKQRAEDCAQPSLNSHAVPSRPASPSSPAGLNASGTETGPVVAPEPIHPDVLALDDDCTACGAMLFDPWNDCGLLDQYKGKTTSYLEEINRWRSIAHDTKDGRSKAIRYLQCAIVMVKRVIAMQVDQHSAVDDKKSQLEACLTVLTRVEQLSKSLPNQGFRDRLLVLRGQLTAMVHMAVFRITQASIDSLYKEHSGFLQNIITSSNLGTPDATPSSRTVSPSSRTKCSDSPASSSVSTSSVPSLTDQDYLMVPGETYAAMKAMLNSVGHLYTAEATWMETMNLLQTCKDTFHSVSCLVGGLALESSLLHAVNFVSRALAEVLKSD